MPKSPISSKQTRKSTTSRNPTRNEENDHYFSDDFESDRELDQEEENNAKVLYAIRQNLEQKVKRSSTRSAVFQSRKKAIYTQARKNAQEIVNSGVSILEDIQTKLAEYQRQGVAFQKYHEDCLLPSHAHKETFDELNKLYPPMLEGLGKRRAEKINAASRMLKDNCPARQDILKEFSKNARHQLEQAKQREKEAVDATEMINNIKNMLRA